MATTTGATTQQHWRTKYSAILFKSLDHSTDWKLLQLLLSTIASLATITVNSCKIVYLRVCLIDIEYQLPLSSKANSGMNFFPFVRCGNGNSINHFAYQNLWHEFSLYLL